MIQKYKNMGFTVITKSNTVVHNTVSSDYKKIIKNEIFKRCYIYSDFGHFQKFIKYIFRR